MLRQACEIAGPLYDGKVDLTGTPLLQHALGAASILAGMHMDHETISATILHAVPEYLDNWQEKIEKDFGANVKVLVEGIARMEQIEQFSEIPRLGKKNKDEAAQQIESLRQMLLAMVEDIRVVLIKLAEQNAGSNGTHYAPIDRAMLVVFAHAGQRGEQDGGHGGAKRQMHVMFGRKALHVEQKQQRGH